MKHYNEYKKAKIEMIKKYLDNKFIHNKHIQARQSTSNKQLDLFISINKFLAKEHSKGPNADIGNINYMYQNYSNVYDFFYILTKYYGFDKVVCKPKFVLKYKNYIVNSAFIIYYDINEITIPVDLKNTIQDCISKNNIRFIYSGFIIDSSNNTGISHVNMIVIDLFKKTVERFEPHGKYMVTDKYEVTMTKSIDDMIKTQFMELSGLNDFKYISPVNLEPVIGPQLIGDLFTGMCVTFSMIYLHLRLMNPDVKPKSIVTYLTNLKTNGVKDMISRYARFIEDTLKNHQYDIEHNYDKLVKAWNSRQEYYLVSTNKRKIIMKRLVSSKK